MIEWNDWMEWGRELHDTLAVGPPCDSLVGLIFLQNKESGVNAISSGKTGIHYKKILKLATSTN